nr:immunoglobulin light chain junction region [Macaca mulatta]MOV93836.1 immunoglobulin light chain junction region [Macaca mulatta]
CLQHKTYPPTF